MLTKLWWTVYGIMNVNVTLLKNQMIKKERLMQLEQVPTSSPLHAIYVLVVVLDAQMIKQSASTHVTKV
jgi:hypothetical protein